MAPEEQGPVPMMGYIVQFQILTADKVAAASGMIYIKIMMCSPMNIIKIILKIRESQWRIRYQPN